MAPGWTSKERMCKRVDLRFVAGWLKRNTNSCGDDLLTQGAEFLQGFDHDAVSWIFHDIFSNRQVGLRPVVCLRGNRLAEIGAHEETRSDLILESAAVLE